MIDENARRIPCDSRRSLGDLHAESSAHLSTRVARGEKMQLVNSQRMLKSFLKYSFAFSVIGIAVAGLVIWKIVTSSGVLEMLRRDPAKDVVQKMAASCSNTKRSIPLFEEKEWQGKRLRAMGLRAYRQGKKKLLKECQAMESLPPQCGPSCLEKRVVLEPKYKFLHWRGRDCGNGKMRMNGKLCISTTMKVVCAGARKCS